MKRVLIHPGRGGTAVSTRGFGPEKLNGWVGGGGWKAEGRQVRLKMSLVYKNLA